MGSWFRVLLLLSWLVCGACSATARMPELPPALDGAGFDDVDEGVTARVLIFISTDCPIANAYAPELQRIHGAYASRGIELILVYVDQGVTADELRAHLEAYGHDARALHDPQLSLVRWAGVRVTPEALLVSSAGRHLYRGRIDDLYTDLGRRRAHATQHDLRAALDAFLAGEPVPAAVAPAVGCLLPLPMSR